MILDWETSWGFRVLSSINPDLGIRPIWKKIFPSLAKDFQPQFFQVQCNSICLIFFQKNG